jgi:hypothetical protein
MTFTDWTGFTGVTILLLAFAMNAGNRISKDHIAYILLNLTGAGIACYASILLYYWPFIILEAAWSLISLIALVNYFRRAG